MKRVPRTCIRFSVIVAAVVLLAVGLSSASSATATVFIETSVVAPNSVQVTASRVRPDGSALELRMDAISGAHGQDPSGTFTFSLEGDDKVSGRVACVNVSGNRANVGVVIDNSDPPVPAGATKVTGLMFFLTDNGSPGAGRDTLTFAGGVGPLPYRCTSRFTSRLEKHPITDGDITIVDTP